MIRAKTQQKSQRRRGSRDRANGQNQPNNQDHQPDWRQPQTLCESPIGAKTKQKLQRKKEKSGQGKQAKTQSTHKPNQRSEVTGLKPKSFKLQIEPQIAIGDGKMRIV